MTEKDRIASDNFYKERNEKEVELLLRQISPDIENRNNRDIHLLAKAAEMSKHSVERSLDLWGQVLDAANRLESKPEDFVFWISDAKYLAEQQLQMRLDQLKLDRELSVNPLEAIVRVYQVGSVLYKKYNLEACRVSQIYFYHYHSLVKPGEKDDEDNAIVRFYTVCIGIQALGFANIANCHYDCLAIAGRMEELFEEINSPSCSDFEPDEFDQLFTKNHLLLGYYAAIAAQNAGHYTEALDWSKQAELYVTPLEDAWIISDLYYWRGQTLIGIGQAEEALTWFEKAAKVPGLNPEDLENANMRLERARDEITGKNSNFSSSEFFAHFVSGEDLENMKHLFDSFLTGNNQEGDLSNAFEIMKKMIIDPTAEKFALNKSLKALPADAEKIKDFWFLITAREAVSKNNLDHVERLIPEIKRIAGSNSANRLSAAFFLLRYRQHRGESLTWDDISPLVSGLITLPGISLLDHLMDLSAILIPLDESELLKASAAISTLLKAITFDDPSDKTPLAVTQSNAISMAIKNTFFTLLVRMAGVHSDNAGWWLENLSRLKYLSGYPGQRHQEEAQLFRYSSKLPKETAHRIANLAETLTKHSLNSKKTGDTVDTERQKIETELMTLLYPLYHQYSPSQEAQDFTVRYPEILHIETSGFLRMENRESPVISAAYCDGHWRAYIPEEEIAHYYAKDYLKLLHKPVFLEYGIQVGMELRKVLLPIFDDSTPPPLLGVRSTGYYHRIPLDTLPLSIDETTGEVTRWVGEKTVSVLLTGKNSDLEILEKQLSLEQMAVFANSEFNGEFRRLGGAVKEAEAIKNIMKTKTGTAMEVFLESDSNRSNFLRLSGGNAPQVLHISTHGIVHEENPSSGFIVLSNENPAGQPILGAVGYHDIMLMDLRPCDLVVLSACSTHEGKSILGEGIMGLAWAFKAAGAGAVIGTRWEVGEQVAVEFWGKFYENIHNGLPIGQAFLGARLHVMNREEWRHPHYWGVFQLIV